MEDEDEDQVDRKPTKLVKLSGKSDIPTEVLLDAEVALGRTSSTTIPDQRVSGVHCRVTPLDDGGEHVASVTDVSSNGTYVNGAKLEKGKPFKLKHGDRLALVNSANGGIEFIVVAEPGTHAAALGESMKRSAEEPAAGEEPAAKAAKHSSMEEHLMCVICQELLHQPVCAVPCLHNFCGGELPCPKAVETTCLL